MTRRERLQQAAALIEDVATTLNSKSRLCPCCGCTVHEDRWQHQKAIELEAIQRKLVRFADEQMFDD